MHFNIVATSQSPPQAALQQTLTPGRAQLCEPCGKEGSSCWLELPGPLGMGTLLTRRWAKTLSHFTSDNAKFLNVAVLFQFHVSTDHRFHLSYSSAQSEWRVHREYSSMCVYTPFVMMQMMVQSERQQQIMYLGAGCEPLQVTLINYWHKQPD